MQVAPKFPLLDYFWCNARSALKVRAWKQGGDAGNPKEYDKGTVKPRYLIAQALILVWWGLDWAILGTPANAASDSNGFVVSVVA